MTFFVKQSSYILFNDITIYLLWLSSKVTTEKNIKKLYTFTFPVIDISYIRERLIYLCNSCRFFYWAIKYIPDLSDSTLSYHCHIFFYVHFVQHEVHFVGVTLTNYVRAISASYNIAKKCRRFKQRSFSFLAITLAMQFISLTFIRVIKSFFTICKKFGEIMLTIICRKLCTIRLVNRTSKSSNYS